MAVDAYWGIGTALPASSCHATEAPPDGESREVEPGEAFYIVSLDIQTGNISVEEGVVEN